MLRDMARHSKIVHGKFFEVTDDLEEYSIPYAEVVRALRDGGFHGYIVSEYEGHKFNLNDDGCQAMHHTVRHQKMLDKLI